MTRQLRIALGQMEVVPGRPDLNTETILNMTALAREQQADMIVFPEMSIPGYLLGDAWEQPAFIRDCVNLGQKVVEASHGICILFGNVGVDWQKKGDDGRLRKYNAFFVAQDGKLMGGDNFPYPFRIKSLQPNYREFDDTRHFYSLRKLALEMDKHPRELLQPVHIHLNGGPLKLGCILCEDGWSDDYSLKPVTEIQMNGPVDLMVNISSSPFTLGKNNKRNRVFSRQAKEIGVPLIYVNNVGIQNNGKTVYTFDGFSTAYNSEGNVTAFCRPFEAGLKTVDLDLLSRDSAPVMDVPDDGNISAIYQALRFGITKFLGSIGMKRTVIGLSGGIDSAVNACLYAQVLGPENVLLVNMPSIYNSETTKGLAAQLAANLGCLYAIMPIQESVEYTVNQVSGTVIKNLSSGEETRLELTPFMVENVQARDRFSRILAAVAAAFGCGFTSNANKSETTVGYSTLYGDHAGFLASLADLWKHQVYDLAVHMNSHIYGREVIPQGIIDLVPSAELSFEQAVDEGKGDPIIYPYHDYLFRAFMEKWDKATPEDILEWYAGGILEKQIGCEAGLVSWIFAGPAEFISDLERWWRLYTGIGVAKRIQAPPVIAVSRRSYGFDHREAQNGVYYTARYRELKEALLNAAECGNI